MPPLLGLGLDQMSTIAPGTGRAFARLGSIFLLLVETSTLPCFLGKVQLLHPPVERERTESHLVPRAPPLKWVGEVDEGLALDGERLPLFLADCTAVVRAGAFGGAAADVGERALSRAAASPAGGVETVGLGRGDTSGGVLERAFETARMPFFFWRTLAMLLRDDF